MHHKVNNRFYTIHSSFEEEFGFDANKNYLFELPFLKIIKVAGTRASEFLQGQLTCDVREINESIMRQGALCNLKGRIQALLDVIDWQGYQLILPEDLVADTTTLLQKAALLSRVTLEQAKDYDIFGFYLSNSQDLLPLSLQLPLEPYSSITTEGGYGYALGGNSYLLVTSKHKSPTLINAFAEKKQLRGSLGWHYLQLKRQRVQIYPETRGLFLPHRLNLHKTNYISFDKGCYKGQEIIARTHYRAKLKHGLKNFSIHTEEPVFAGQKIMSLENNSEIGEVIDFCPIPQQHYLIVGSLLHEHPSHAILEGQKQPALLT